MTVIRYTVIYTGISIKLVTDEPVEEPSQGMPWALLAIPVILVATALGAGGTYLILNKRKEKKEYEEAAHDGCGDCDADGVDGGVGRGPGISG
ncbi:hypothetical protein SDC9_154536 [bioreactor metagenome]|uniref:Uncharacterized protein n=1 Tax=bioreactor metagenome TaxID=1076179 RepID=A0A645F0J5_9ZZZZ